MNLSDIDVDLICEATGCDAEVTAERKVFKLRPEGLDIRVETEQELGLLAFGVYVGTCRARMVEGFMEPVSVLYIVGTEAKGFVWGVRKLRNAVIRAHVLSLEVIAYRGAQGYVLPVRWVNGAWELGEKPAAMPEELWSRIAEEARGVEDRRSLMPEVD